jgi:two-component system sensor histidine kinase/response regulator
VASVALTRLSPADLDRDELDRRLRWAFLGVLALLVAYLVYLAARPIGEYKAVVDGWGVDAFEVSMGLICIGRFYYRSWRSTAVTARIFPLVMGAACLAWGLGDVALTIESLGGRTAAVPSVADGFYICFFPLAYISYTMVIRRGTRTSLLATSLDALIAGLASASVVAAFAFSTVMRASGSGELSTATNLAYPIGDLLLLALAIGGAALLPKEYRRFLVIASVAMAANATGDMFNLLQPSSRVGYVTDALAWPISLSMLAFATWTQSSTAWTPATHAAKVSSEKTAGFTLPALAGLSSVAVLFSASIAHVGKPALALATGTLLIAGIRLTLSVREARTLNSARFRSLVDNAWDLILVAGADLAVAYVTPSSERVLGYTPAEMERHPLVGLVHPDDAEVLQRQLRQLGDALDETATFETRMRRRDGAWRVIAWTATNLLGDPSVRGYVLNGGDVTDAQRAAADLSAARDEALLASSAKSNFLSRMSHEIRTPMNGVIGLTELLLGTELDSDQYEFASGVKVSAENLLHIINDILDFSKIEAGHLEIEETELSVAAIADDVGRILAATAHGKGLELLVDVHPSVPATLLGDKVRIQQVLLNLASNAVKFTDRGEVVIRISLLHGTAERAAVRFDVIDQGIGIAAGDQQRLFQAFAQADSSTTRRFGGTGLGLAIARQLLELMGGELGVISAPGQGSTFWFELSLARAHEEQASSSSDPRGLDGQSALIVDDNATNRNILRRQLASWGVETVEAVDGYEALGLAASAAGAGRPFGFAVIDLNMPGMDGIELAGILKGDQTTAATTMILLSSSGDRLGAARSHLYGFAASLTKPVRQSELFDCLMTTMNAGEWAAGPGTQPAAERRTPSAGTILLVEDNDINQLVGSKALAKLGYDVEIACDGREAVEAVKARRFDAVLMDCQMPEMDGYEATAEIRRLEGNTRRTPIIAMTAGAMDGDREACFAAGMDGYISKPVRLEAIASALDLWIGRSGPAPRDGTAPAPPPSERPEALDGAQIEFLRSLDDGDGTLLEEIVQQYLAQAHQGRDEMVRLFEQGDSRGLERCAHTLKGASANVGASGLAAICADLEARGHEGRLESVMALVGHFEAELARVETALDLVVTRS